MSDSRASAWFEQFFTGAALDVWRQAISPEQTDQEVVFLEEVLAADIGAHILDVPCGNGRLTLPLARLGYQVSGLDFSEQFVREAKERAASEKNNVTFIQGDMRNLHFPSKLDGAYCMGNSFGYFDRPGTEKFLQAVARTLNSGANFVLDSLMVAESFLVNGAEREWLRVGEIYMLIENKYDPRDSCVETTYTFLTDGKEDKRQALHYIYTSGEIVYMLNNAGFEVIDLFGSPDFEPYELGTERLLLVARKR